jgi:hypothetical protein
MKPWILALTAVCLGCASYPARYPRLGEAALAETEARLRRASGGMLDKVKLDPYGFVIDLRTRALGRFRPEGPPPPHDAARLTRWVGAEMPPFGVTDEPRSTFFTYDSGQLDARQVVTGHTIGRIFADYLVEVAPPGGAAWTLRIMGHFWPGAVIPSSGKVDPVELQRQIVGLTYDTLLLPVPAPCVHDTPCPLGKPEPGVKTITAEQVTWRKVVVAVRANDQAPLELRRVVRVDVADKLGTLRYSPRGSAPRIPCVLDDVTGEDLSTWEWCRMLDGLCFPWTSCEAGNCGPLD